MNKDVMTGSHYYKVAWVVTCLFFCVIGSQVAAGPLAVEPAGQELKIGETLNFLIPDSSTYLIIQNQGIDTITSAIDAEGNVLHQSATWRGREGQYVLQLNNAVSVSIQSAEQHSPIGRFSLQWIHTHSPTLSDIAEGAHYHLSNQAGSNDIAINHFQQAMDVLPNSDYVQWTANVLYELGILYRANGHLTDAEKYFEQAIQSYSSLADYRGLAAARNTLGLVMLDQGKRELALEQFNIALMLRQAEKNGFYTAQAISNIALLHWQNDDYLAASLTYEKALAIYQKLDRKPLSRVANTMNNLALAKSSLGLVDEAEMIWKEALSLSQTLNEQKKIAEIQVNLGKLYQEQGRLEAALHHLNAAVRTFTQQDNSVWLGTALSVIGNVYAFIDEPQSALIYYQQALDFVGENQRQRANTLTQMALANGSLGNDVIAEQQFKFAYDSYIQSDQPGAAAVVLSKYGQFLQAQGQSQLAIDHQRQAIKTLSMIGQVRETARAQSRLGQLLLLNGQQAEAEQVLEAALIGHQAVSDELSELDTLTSLSKAQTGAAALESAQKSIDLALNIRSETTTAGIQQSFIASRHDAFSNYIDLLIDQGELNKAWLINEKMRGRSLLDSMQSSDQQWVGMNQPIGLAELQSSLSAGTTLLSYFLSDKKSHLWVISHHDMTYYPISSADQINVAAANLAQVLRSERQSPSRISYLAEQLSGLVLPADMGKLDRRKVVVIADGALQLVPFGLLSVNDRLLVEQSMVTYSPSANIYAVINAKPRSAINDILVLADPLADGVSPQDDLFATPKINLASLTAQRSLEQTGINIARLPGAQLEAEAIKQFSIQADVMTGVQASYDYALSGALRDYDVVHFATHGVVDADVPALSGLILSSGFSQHDMSYLRPHDIIDLDLNANLVVLSGCETGIGKTVNGEGVLSLSRPFLIAGAKQVVSTLWKVSDRATAQLMERFYFHLLEQKQSPERALSAAQQWMRERSEWQHPYYWAAFVIQGA